MQALSLTTLNHSLYLCASRAVLSFSLLRYALTLLLKFKVQALLHKPLKNFIMNHLLNLLLIIMSGVCAIEIVTVDSKEELVFAVTGLALSLMIMIVNIISPLFPTENK